MKREVRYCTTDDGVRIAYYVEGAGRPLVICPYFLESFANDDELTPEWRGLFEGIGNGRQVIRFDTRGTGLSQRDGCEMSHEGLLSDVTAVVRAAGLERFDLLAWVLSGVLAIDYAARHPEQVERLVLYAGFARSTDVMPREALTALAGLCRINWQMASQTFVDMSMRQEAPETGLRLAEILRQTFRGEVLAAVMDLDLDVTESLASVQAATLVLHRVNDTAIPFAASQVIASQIPNAQLVPLKGGVNYPALGDTQAIIDAIVEFLRRDEATTEKEPEPELAPGGFRTILFTDVVGHTEMMRRLGDDAGREVLREHERITREALRAHGGSEVKAMGDGFMASFASATRALECAMALQRAFAERAETAGEPISVRVGVNAGEPIAEEGDLFGTAVILAARIAAQAAGGEVLVSEAVRQIVAGKQFLFSDRGTTAMRGFEDPVQVYELNWRN